jgi:hypothetical protein
VVGTDAGTDARMAHRAETNSNFLRRDSVQNRADIRAVESLRRIVPRNKDRDNNLPVL